jgi:putative phosphoesterase
MRVAVVSDIHGNRTAFEAVLADLRETSPDLVLQGGDLVHGGSSSADVVDNVRELGWPGVAGNTDEMMWRPEALDRFAGKPPFDAIGEMAAVERERLGEARLAWLRALPLTRKHGKLALVHASPGNLWNAPLPEEDNDELKRVYQPLGCPIAIYAHIHRPYIRRVTGLTVVNTGSVGLPFDGDPRASYLLVEESEPIIRRVEYDIGKELAALADSGLPHSTWVARMLTAARPLMP